MSHVIKIHAVCSIDLDQKLIMSHLVNIYAVCKFDYFRLWYLKS